MLQRKMIKRELMANGTGIILGEKTLIMGILNVTPDSFSDGGRFNQIEAGISQAMRMVSEGADIIDIGGESTRPGSELVSLEEELSRVIPVIKALRQQTDCLISIDTYKAGVAQEALKLGANIVNDVWGFQKDPDIAKVAATYQVPSILMHNQIGTEYSGDIIESIRKFFDQSIEWALKQGLKEKMIILDPGIGFGKTPLQNVQVMRRIDEIKAIGYPVLLGTSRKSMIGKILDLPADQRLEGTIASNVIGMMTGCEIIRVHDVKEHVRAGKVVDSIYKGQIDG